MTANLQSFQLTSAGELEVFPEDTIEKLKKYAYIFRKCTFLLASWISLSPEIEIKVLFGDHIHRDALTFRKCLDRLLSLGFSGDGNSDFSNYLNEDICKVSLLKNSARKLVAMYQGLKSNILMDVKRFAKEIHSILDQPTVRLCSEIIIDIESQIEEARCLQEKLCCIFPDIYTISEDYGDLLQNIPSNAFCLTVPDLPARDKRFRLTNDSSVWTNHQKWQDNVIQDIHFLLMSLEIVSIEVCSRNILEFTTLPWDFILDMTRQCWDESRHAKALYNRILELGGEIGGYPIDYNLWLMTSGLPLAVRLAIHQRIGEWIGVDAAILSVSDCENNNDFISAQIYTYITRDEITHVNFGNKWIRYLASSDEEVKNIHQVAQAQRDKFKGTSPLVPFPFNRWACELSGFTNQEIDELEIEVNQRRKKA